MRVETASPLGRPPCVLVGRWVGSAGPVRVGSVPHWARGPRCAPAVTTRTNKGGSPHPHVQYLGRSPPAEEGPNPPCSAGRIPVVYRAGGRDQGVSGLGWSSPSTQMSARSL